MRALLPLGAQYRAPVLPRWWKKAAMKLGGNMPSVAADFGRDRYAMSGVGPNLVVNSDFSAGLTGWTDASTPPSYISAVNGKAVFNTDGVAVARLKQTVTTVPGKVYSLTTTGQVEVAAGTTLNGANLLDRLTGTTCRLFVATTTSCYIGLAATANGMALSSVVLREVLADFGPNLVQNGDFTTSLAGWDTSASTAPSTFVWSSANGGQAVSSTDGTNSARLRQSLSTIPGRTYVITSTGGITVGVGTTSGAIDILGYGAATSRVFTATTSTTWLSSATAFNGGALDNVSVREVLVGFGPELVTNGTFDTSLTGWTDASTAPSTVTWSSANGGQALFTSDASNPARLRQQITTVPGRTYVITSSGSVGLTVGTAPSGADILDWATVVGYPNGRSRVFVAPGNVAHIGFYTNNPALTTADNVSMREVLTNQPVRSVTFNEMFLLSSGTKNVVANDNMLRTVPANSPAWDYATKQRRLRLEGAATQLVPYSNSFNLWSNGSGGVSLSQNAADPFGNANSAWTLTQTGADGTDTRLQSNIGVTANTLDYANSIFIKKTTGTPATFPALTGFSTGGGGVWVVVVHTTTGELVTNATATRFGIEDGGNGFWRVFVVAANASSTTMVIQIYPSWTNTFSIAKNTKQGGSAVVFGGMMAQESGLSSYIASSGSQVTRVTDLYAFSPLLNLCMPVSTCSIAYRANIKTLVAGQALIGLNGWPLLRGGGGGPQAVLIDGSSSVTIAIGNALPGEVGAAFGWDATATTGSINGLTPVSNTQALDKQKPPFFLGHSTGMASGAIHLLGSFAAWPLKGSNSNLQSQARAYA